MSDRPVIAPVAVASSAFVCSQAPLGVDCCCCKRCQYGGCDLKVLDCGCCLHTRCCPLDLSRADHSGVDQQVCPVCGQVSRTLYMMPMAFDEMNAAQAEAAQTNLSSKRGKKRQNATVARLVPSATANGSEGGNSSPRDAAAVAPTIDSAGNNKNYSELRTGRWTEAEMAYCDKLIELFDAGKLPVEDGAKLNDFLANMFKSKQSRLTKKMKNARLSIRTYQRTTGYIDQDDEAKAVSHLETEFFASIKCRMERSEIRFHMQKEWRELFSKCVGLTNAVKLAADVWLNSVEEMDRRLSIQKDAARMARRKILMGVALSHDSRAPPPGVFIDPTAASEATSIEHMALPLHVGYGTAGTTPNIHATDGGGVATDGGSSAVLADDAEHGAATSSTAQKRARLAMLAKPIRYYSSPFAGKIIQFLQRHSIPFEHVDIWVPSFVPTASNPAAPSSGQQQCRLCFAGFATAEIVIRPPSESFDGDKSGATNIKSYGAPELLTSQVQFDLLSFGDYSQKFSFDVGCGLPGRVYATGVSIWEQCIQGGTPAFFERAGGAQQWGIQTVLGVPIPSPNVGRLVVVFYSRYDRVRDQEIVNKLADELTRLLPAPRWKLVVDIAPLSAEVPATKRSKVDAKEELGRLLRRHAPEDKDSILAPYLPGFASLLLLLQRPQQLGPGERNFLQAGIDLFVGHKAEGRDERDLAWMTARDFMRLSRVPAASAVAQSTITLNNDSTGSNGVPSCGVGGRCGPGQKMGMPQSEKQQVNVHVNSTNASLFSDVSAAASPDLHAMAGQIDLLAPLGLTPAQITAMFQYDGNLNFQGI